MKVKKINHQKFKDPASKTTIDIQYFENQGHACDFSEVAFLALPLLLTLLLPALLLLPEDLRLPLDGAPLDAASVLPHGHTVHPVGQPAVPQPGDGNIGNVGHLEVVIPFSHALHVGCNETMSMTENCWIDCSMQLIPQFNNILAKHYSPLSLSLS